MLTWIAIIISTTAAFVGLFSDSWDSKKKGLSKLTTKGWISFLLLLAGTIVTIIITRNKSIEEEELRRQAFKMKQHAYKSLVTACEFEAMQFTSILLMDSTKGLVQNAQSEFMDLLGSPKVCDYLSSPEGYKVLSRIYLTINGLVLKKGNMKIPLGSIKDVFEVYLQQNQKVKVIPNTLDVKNTWSDYLELEDILRIDSLENHDLKKNIKTGFLQSESGEFEEKKAPFVLSPHLINDFFSIFYRLWTHAEQLAELKIENE